MKKLFEEYFGVQLSDKPQQDIHCIWHDDKRESLSISLETGDFCCHGCGRSGNIANVAQEMHAIAESEVDRWHEMLISEPKLMAWLKSAKGWSEETIKKYKIGHNGGRFTLPVRDSEGGICINLRLYSSTATPKVVPYSEGFGSVAWFPFPPDGNVPEVFLMEGESDTLLARQLGFPAFCQTGGAQCWTDEFTKALAGKNVNIVYDMDPPGRKGASKVINSIKFSAASVRNVHIPVGTGGKDFSDWFLRGLGVTPAIFVETVKNTAPHAVSSSAITMDAPTPMPLWEIVRSIHAHKPVECEVMVASKSGSPYLIPKQFVIECPASSKMCASCQNVSGNKSYEIDWRDPALLSMVDVSEEYIPSKIRRILDIPSACRLTKIQVNEFQNVERIGMIPRIDWHIMRQMSGEFAAQSRKGYFIGTGIKANEAYTVRGVVVPDPTDQSAVLMVVEAEPVVDDHTTLDLQQCEIFRVEEEGCEQDKEHTDVIRRGSDGEDLQDIREE